MIKIYHNPRCSKSRQGLDLLTAKGLEFETVKYLENPPSQEELEAILKKLAIKPIELIRKGEKIWKENFKGKELTDEDLIAAMVQYPKLIERPIIIVGDKAVIGRPLEKIETIL